MPTLPSSRTLLTGLSLLSCAILLGFTSSRNLQQQSDPGEERSGGDTTVVETNRRAFSLPAANMSLDRRARFAVGHAFFNQPWVEAPSSTAARDGLGPHFIARSCTACHSNDGRAAPPVEADEQPMGLLFRLSIAGEGEHGSPKPEPTYGGQFNNQAVDGVKPEGKVNIQYTEMPGKFADGEPYALRKPSYQFTDLGYGPMQAGTLVSPRIAQQVIGLGLLEAIPAEAIRKQADPDDRNKDGISGRPNLVWDAVSKRMQLGRFGWKANTPNVAHQSAGAFNGDIGITSSLFPTEECTPSQKDCQQAARGGKPEIAEHNLQAMIFYTRTLAVPARREVDKPQVIRGKQLFAESNCIACHTASWKTGTLAGLPEVSRQWIHPYTDLLLHDMGEGLADGRPDFQATGREWRTPPLWGIGLIPTVNGHSYYLHDGRARNLSEAVLWHDGEAAAARSRFLNMNKQDREALLAFLNSL
ncbi:di-heme oxidoreductase family protein [Leeia aquatica]|uniref:C-type cytochrome n=1 Tax=Leeia aquatica TaxID=2725557 RepID=A0A847S1Y8_9NEIS|nr:di-heme oxidoredictase family protein [Leeia aquatica]NLR73763.1 c-type cytochrome [Leeia aquatica]